MSIEVNEVFVVEGVIGEQSIGDYLIVVEGLCNLFGDQVIYEDLLLKVWCGEIFGVVGGLGIGKLVLMCLIIGL